MPVLFKALGTAVTINVVTALLKFKSTKTSDNDKVHSWQWWWWRKGRRRVTQDKFRQLSLQHLLMRRLEERKRWDEEMQRETSVEEKARCSCLNVHWNMKTEVLVAQLFLTLCKPVDSSPPVSSVHGILQARLLQRSSQSWLLIRTASLTCFSLLLLL